MKAGQLIHSTATPEDSSEAATQASRRYIPRAVLPEEFEHWKSYLENFTEKDLMDISEGIVKGLTETSPSKIDALENILRSGEMQAFCWHIFFQLTVPYNDSGAGPCVARLCEGFIPRGGRKNPEFLGQQFRADRPNNIPSSRL